MFQILAIFAAIAAAVTAFKASTVKVDPGTLHAPHDVIYLNTVMLKATMDANEVSALWSARIAWLSLASLAFQVFALLA